MFPPELMREWCHDILSASNHCVKSGVYLKWLSVDQLYVSATGRLVIGGFGEGAVMADQAKPRPAPTGGADGDKDEKDDKHKHGKDKHKHSKEKDKEKDKHKHRKDKDKAGDRDKEREKDKPATPLPCLSTTAPEIILGAAASRSSTYWVAGAVMVHLVAGKPLVRVSISAHPYID
jgi:hypothetical protein